MFALVLYYCYAPGFSGSLFYDDTDNLSKLENINDFDSAKKFVLSGIAGPLKRPIALASFLPHAADWPDNVSEALQMNAFIHIVNAILFFLLGYLLLGLVTQLDKKRVYYTALFAAAMWAFLPLLASTSLITVQRMTSLSALFTLLGLLGFVWSYSFRARQPKKAFILQMLFLATGTILAIFTKENGALTPVYALVIDVILMRKLQNRTQYDHWRRRLLLLGLIALLIYLSPLYRDWFTINENRGFSAWERLNTQMVILWQYIYHAFLPQQPTYFGPYHDDMVLINNTGLVIFAAFAWIAALFVSIKLLSRTPWPLFALLWFFTGHLLESTVINLELVFEHRNYLAVYGFCLALSVAAWSASGRLARFWPILLGIYISLLCGILLAVTMRWGEPDIARKSWVDAHPASPRAALKYIQLDHNFENMFSPKTDVELHSIQRAIAVLDRLINICPKCTEIRLQALIISCHFTNTEDTAERFSDILKHASTGKLNISVVDALFPLREQVKLNACKPLNAGDLTKLLDLLIENPRMKILGHSTRIHFVAAMIAEDNKDYSAVEKLLSHAESTNPKALPVLQYQVYFYRGQQRVDDALAAIDRRRRYLPGIVLDQLEKDAQDIHKTN